MERQPVRIEFFLHLLITGGLLMTGLFVARQVKLLTLPGVAAAEEVVYDLPEVVVRPGR
ncbi:hypothetical protein [Gloeobacter violaceus]|uniref:hypothetical protein n=1 Tax=Gloeobacter violaceus TaxID=33072 RepID=UPI0002E90E85|nr:hypothetical protein [Gloeobacter violaceus]